MANDDNELECSDCRHWEQCTEGAYDQAKEDLLDEVLSTIKDRLHDRRFYVPATRFQSFEGYVVSEDDIEWVLEEVELKEKSNG